MEIWKDVKNYEGIYQVSDLGNIKSLDRLINHWKGSEQSIKGRMLKPQKNPNGYYAINLSKDGKQKMHRIHILIAVAFLNHIPDGGITQVDHVKEGNKLDNRASNLQLITGRENVSKYHKRRKTSSIYIGVSLCGRSGKWKSQILIDGKCKHLGYFKKELEASNAYQIALKNIRTNVN